MSHSFKGSQSPKFSRLQYSADAQRYQEKDVRNSLRDLAKLEEEDPE